MDGVPSSELSYTQDTSTNTTTLTVVRPVDLLVWSINMTSPTYVVFATGNSNTFGKHSANRGVSVCVARLQRCRRHWCCCVEWGEWADHADVCVRVCGCGFVYG